MNMAYIISIICLAFCFFIFFYLKWYIKRRTSASELLAEYRTEVRRLIVEINAATDRDTQLVEERIKTLKTILGDTDKRVAVYARELERSRTGEALYTSLGRGIRAALKTPVETTPSQPEQTQGAQTQSAQTPGVQTPLPAQQESRPVPEAPAGQSSQKNSSKRQIRAQIEAMVNQGLPPAEIASRLNISLSEVDLAINLIERLRKK